MQFIYNISSQDWFLLIIGIAIPISFSIIKKIWIYFSNFQQLTPLLGEWHKYHWSRANNCTLFRYEKWNISRSLFFGIKVTAEDSENEVLQYKGILSFQGNSTVMNLISKKHRQESFQFRANDPIPVPNGNTIIKGLFLGLDFDRKTFSSISVLLKKPLEDESAKNILRAFSNYSDTDLSLRLKENFSKEEKIIIGDLQNSDI